MGLRMSNTIIVKRTDSHEHITCRNLACPGPSEEQMNEPPPTAYSYIQLKDLGWQYVGGRDGVWYCPECK